VPAKLISAAASVLAAAALTGAATSGRAASAERRPVQMMFTPRSIDLFHAASVEATGIVARSVEVRLVGAIDRAGLAYEWTPYRWRPLRAQDGAWRGLLTAPPLFGIYRLRLRLDHGRSFLSSARWLIRVFPRGTMARPSFPTAVAAIRQFVSHLPGHVRLVALRRWPLARFDHRDPRLNRLFVIAYAPRGDNEHASRSGLFVSTVRDGFRGRWRVLQATAEPYG
jgi:hypothetical protein